MRPFSQPRGPCSTAGAWPAVFLPCLLAPMTSAVAPRIGTPNGTTRLQASTALCPQLARADISPLDDNSGYDPERKSSARFCCDAQQLPSDMVGYHPRV